MTTVNNPKVSPSSDKDENLKEQGFLNRSRASDKTLWDWLQLLGVLAVPLVVAGATLFFSIQQANLANQQHDYDQKIASQQREADQQQTLDQQRQATFVTYLANMNDLLLNRGLLTSKPGDEIRVIARTETLSSMRQLDWKRNRFLSQFLIDAHLIGVQSGNIVSFRAADLFSIDLSYAILAAADFSYANLNRTNLNSADLILTNLYGAHLNSAKLGRAILANADLSYADLEDADLEDANLHGADLTGVRNLSQQQLDQVYSCKGATLPKGLTCHHNV